MFCLAIKNLMVNVLKKINLEFEGGKMTSLVGHSGSGKSTILSLIPRFYDCWMVIFLLITNQYMM